MADRSQVRESLSRAVHSIRTRNAVVTGAMLLLFLGLFYAGGRIVLAGLVRDTASQVRDAGRCVASRIQRQADALREAVAAALARPGADAASPRDFLAADGAAFSFVARFAPDGAFLDGAAVSPRHRGAALAPPPDALAADDFAGYEPVIRDWAKALSSARGRASPESFETGLLRVGGRLHCAVLVRRDGDYALFGAPFSALSIVEGEQGHGSHLELRLDASLAAAAPSGGKTAPAPTRRPIPRSSVRSSTGLSPMFTETTVAAADAPFWAFRSDRFETVFVLRDISGEAVSELSVSLPRVFSSATRMAAWQLAFFVAVGGLLFVFPVFWLQGLVILNPLTRMTKAIVALGEDTSGGVECPRIAWKGKDEFAQLAESVNRLVEAIASRTVTLANMEARHKALIEGVPDALFVCDAQGRLVSVTKQPDGVAPVPGAVPGSPPSAAVFDEADVAAFVRTAKETSRTGALGRARLKTRAEKEADARHFEVRVARTGERHVLAVVRDVTEEFAEHARRLAAEARALDASKRESLTGFAAGIAHDMNNVLTVVLGTADAAAANPNDDKAKAVETIRDAVRRGVAMMRELTDFAGENRMTLLRVRPQVVVDDARQIAERTVGANVELAFEAAPGLPDIDVDLNQFWKVIFNIVRNAGEAIGKRPGHVSLRVIPFTMTRSAATLFVSERPLPEGRGALFEVADDGPGISEEVEARLFDPYVSSKGLGRGLGLATVRTIVEAHGGGIRVSSHPNRGTTFRIFLPASRLPPERALAPAPAAHGGGGRAVPPGDDVLVVDDDRAILATTRILCKAIGLNALVASDRREALAAVRRHAASLRAILLDAHLGSFDTVRLLSAFRLGAPGVPVVVASGASREAMERMFRAHPFDAFLSKPYTLAELKAALADAARPRRPPPNNAAAAS